MRTSLTTQYQFNGSGNIAWQLDAKVWQITLKVNNPAMITIMSHCKITMVTTANIIDKKYKQSTLPANIKLLINL